MGLYGGQVQQRNVGWPTWAGCMHLGAVVVGATRIIWPQLIIRMFTRLSPGTRHPGGLAVVVENS